MEKERMKKILVEIEIHEWTIMNTTIVGNRAYRKVTQEDQKWWKRQEELVGAKAMVSISQGKWIEIDETKEETSFIVKIPTDSLDKVREMVGKEEGCRDITDEEIMTKYLPYFDVKINRV